LTQYEDTEEKDRLHSEVSRLKKMLGTTTTNVGSNEGRKEENTDQQLLEKVKVLEMERKSLLK